MSEQEAQTTELSLTEVLQNAIDRGFDEARSCLSEEGELLPFSILCTADGYVASDHPGIEARAVYESVKTVIAREMPQSYAFFYDGCLNTDAGTVDAVICEAAKRGDVAAYRLALTYTSKAAAEGGDAKPIYEFAQHFVSTGKTPILYPSGTKPIVSGLVALEAQRRERENNQ